MKIFSKIIGFLFIFGALILSCSIESNKDGAKKSNHNEIESELSSAPTKVSLIANNDMAFAMKGCKYRW